jgi:hypothetical protein
MWIKKEVGPGGEPRRGGGVLVRETRGGGDVDVPCGLLDKGAEGAGIGRVVSQRQLLPPHHRVNHLLRCHLSIHRSTIHSQIKEITKNKKNKQ